MRVWVFLQIAVLLAHLACGSYARRVHASQRRPQNRHHSESKHLPKSDKRVNLEGRWDLSKSLTLLLMEFSPAAAFIPSGFGARYRVHTSDSAHMLQQNLQMKQSTKKKKKGTSSSSGFGASGGLQNAKSFKYTGKLRPGKVSPMREVPSEIQRPDYADDGVPKQRGMVMTVEVKTPEDIKGMRAAGLVAREVLDAAVRKVAVNVTTEEIDLIVHQECIDRGAYPSPLNYCKFPKSCCTSVNEVICHGIPDSRRLEDGDILNIDITVYYNGYHGDCSEMVLVGNVDKAGKKLVKVTHDAWQAAIAYCKPQQPFKGIGEVIEDYVKEHGYASSPDFTGHGIGKVFHTTPTIYHVRNNEKGVMEEGHVFTIEPMICEGKAKYCVEWEDKWTATTKDGKRSAQFEHTFLVTADGVEALTARLPTSAKYWWEEE
mmetsp:Transcript_98481/g.180554  ORF Transcript_98481/g.180554 Transcript_98481/m.180554 type:complete len:430 (+) Transcript_98481:81-1370(+)